MAKKPANALNVTVNSVALEGAIDNASLDTTQETPEVTALSDAGPRRVVGNYDYTMKLDGAADFSSGNSDATLFGLLGNSGVATGFDPTGAAAPGPSDPHYDSTSMVLGTYSLKAAKGAAVTYSAELRGNSALTRTVA